MFVLSIFYTTCCSVGWSIMFLFLDCGFIGLLIHLFSHLFVLSREKTLRKNTLLSFRFVSMEYDESKCRFDSHFSRSFSIGFYLPFRLRLKLPIFEFVFSENFHHKTVECVQFTQKSPTEQPLVLGGSDACDICSC